MTTFSLKKLQKEHREWSDKNFTEPPKLCDYPKIDALNLAKVVGQSAHFVLKADQGIRHSGETCERSWFEKVGELKTIRASHLDTHDSGDNHFTDEHVPNRAVQAALGVIEETGELADAILYARRDDTADAIGDVVLYLVELCNRLNFDLEQILIDVSSKVFKRNWAAEPMHAADEKPLVFRIPEGVEGEQFKQKLKEAIADANKQPAKITLEYAEKIVREKRQDEQVAIKHLRRAKEMIEAGGVMLPKPQFITEYLMQPMPEEKPNPADFKIRSMSDLMEARQIFEPSMFQFVDLPSIDTVGVEGLSLEEKKEFFASMVEKKTNTWDFIQNIAGGNMRVVRISKDDFEAIRYELSNLAECPRCEGAGAYEYYPDRRPRLEFDETPEMQNPCDACKGTGNLGMTADAIKNQIARWIETGKELPDALCELVRTGEIDFVVDLTS